MLAAVVGSRLAIMTLKHLVLKKKKKLLQALMQLQVPLLGQQAEQVLLQVFVHLLHKQLCS